MEAKEELDFIYEASLVQALAAGFDVHESEDIARRNVLFYWECGSLDS